MRCWTLVLSVVVGAAALVGAQQHGASCEIKSTEFPSDYLYMSVGLVSQHPILWSLRPQLASRRKQHGKWRVEKTTVGSKTFYRLWNLGAEAYLVNKASQPAAKKTSSGGNSDELLWKLEAKGQGFTMQQNGQYLSANDVKNGDERSLLMTPKSNKSTAQWTITC